MHDRRIDGETYLFGNAGGLYKNAMTWWDHKTASIWSQPIGQAISGPLEGTKLELLPSQMVTWGNWVEAHPETLAMVTGYPQTKFSFTQKFDQNFVIGVTFAEHAKAYPYDLVAESDLINDRIGEFPVLVWAKDDDYRAYLRQVEGDTLTFANVDGEVVDSKTGSTWDMDLGLATAGPLKGTGLQPVPSLTSFDWAWEDFYPDGDIYSGGQ